MNDVETYERKLRIAMISKEMKKDQDCLIRDTIACLCVCSLLAALCWLT